jgi:DNA ligase (NAD+)
MGNGVVPPAAKRRLTMAQKGKEQIQEKIGFLREVIEEAYSDFHRKDLPLWTDAEYDDLFRELCFLEATNPELILPTSPTQRVGVSK